MIRLLIILLLTGAYGVPSIALESDRKQPAIVDAQNIDIDVSEGVW